MRVEINVQTGEVAEHPDAPVMPQTLTEAEIVAMYDRAMVEHFDTVAKAKHYDNRFTCALRAGYGGPFKSEGQAFALWMDACNAYGYAELAKIKAGQRAMPTVAEFIAELPAAPW